MTFRFKTIGVAVIIGAVAWFCKEPIVAYSTQRDVDFTVLRTERITNADGDGSKYLVWSVEGDTYENTDSYWFLKWNSSDVQGQLVAGKKVTAKITGFRLGLMSWYPNIISVEQKQ